MAKPYDAEVTNVDRMARARQILYFAGLLLVVAVLAYLAGKWNTGNKVEEIEVRNNSITGTEELLGLISGDIIGKVKDSIDLLDLANAVNANPYIERCDAFFESGNRIVLDVNEKIPAAFVEGIDGRLLLSDTSAKLLPFRNINIDGNLVLIEGLDLNSRELEKILSGALEIINTLKKDEFKILYLITGGVKYNNMEKNYEIRLTNSDKPILIGQNENLYEKLRKLELFLENSYYEEEPNDINVIDLRWKNRVVIN